MLDDATVAEAMHRGLITGPADATAVEMAQAMADEQIHSVLVADGESRRAWAVVSELDLMAGLVAGGGQAPATSLAGTEVVTWSPRRRSPRRRD